MSKKLSKILYLIVCFVFFLICDLYFSEMIVRNIVRGYGFSSSIFALHYVKNTGAAFSLLPDAREFLIILSVTAIVLMFTYIWRHTKAASMKDMFFSALLAAGIAGNLHERIVFGYVRDYFEFKFVHFPVFNISDIFITIGVIALIILILIKKTK